MITKELLDILACPQCKQAVQLSEDKKGLLCQQCKLIYEIRDNIPVMLVNEAKPLKKQAAGGPEANDQEIGP